MRQTKNFRLRGPNGPMGGAVAVAEGKGISQQSRKGRIYAIVRVSELRESAREMENTVFLGKDETVEGRVLRARGVKVVESLLRGGGVVEEGGGAA